MKETASKKIIDLGIFAHVDAGKTTLSERILAHCGAIREIGSVDSGTAHTDRSEIERSRGISVYSTCVPVEWKGCRINIIDTPGHVDFIAEVERSMWALDCAIIVISAVEGIQPQTKLVFRALKNKPKLVFINKTDRVNADVEAVKAAIMEELTSDLVDMTDKDAYIEFAAETDEELLDKYINGEPIPDAIAVERIKELVADNSAVPLYAGSALKDIGVDELLDGIVGLLPNSAASPTDMGRKTYGIVFHIEFDKALGRAAYVRMFSGSVKTREMIGDKKVTQIRDIAVSGKGEYKDELSSGDIGILYGLGDIRAGDAIGESEGRDRVEPGALRKPLLLVKVISEDPARRDELRSALMMLSAEDPLLGVEEYQRELHVNIMGTIQLEILEDTLKKRFGLAVCFSDPNVIYRETIERSAQGFYAYTMPKPCWAVIDLLIEPLPRGSGVEFRSVAPVKDISPRYQHQVEQAIENATNQGMLGWKVDDIRITLIGGSEHKFHTHPLDFIVATPIAVMMGLEKAGQVLLEPILDMDLIVPEECAQRTMGEILVMRGTVIDSRSEKNMIHLKGEVPVATSIYFSQKLASLTGGRGSLSAELKGYKEAPPGVMAICPRRGVNPLDTSKYILAARNALDGGIFDY